MVEASGRSSWLETPSVWVVVLATSLIAGALNVAVSTLARPAVHADPAVVLAFMAVNVVAASTAQLVLLALPGQLLIRLRFDRLAVSVGIGILTVSLACVGPLLQPAPGQTLAERAAYTTAILSAAVFAPILSYQVARDASARVRAFGTQLALSGPFAAFCALILVWMRVFRVEGGTVWVLLASLAGVALIGAVALSFGWRRKELPLVWLATTTAGVLLAAPLLLLSAEPKVQASPGAEAFPSVLLLTVDTLRADALDSGAAHTPALAKLSEQSVVFEQARSAGPWTKAGLAPILTGLSPLVHGVTKSESRLPDEVRTLAETLRERGYRTAAIGRNVYLQENSNFDQGFDEYVFFPRSPGASFAGRLLSQVSPALFGSSDPSSEDLTEMARGWIRANGGQPFFLWLHYFDPHLPYAPRPALLHGDPPPDMQRTFDDPKSIRGGYFTPTAAEQGWIRSLYDAEVRGVDANIGEVLRTLQEQGLYDRALIALTSDHGEEFWEHGAFEHGHALYDEVLRVPLLFRFPEGRPARRVSERVSTESLTPTILDALGLLNGAGPFTSPSLMPLARGDSSWRGSPVVSTGMLYFGDKTSLVYGDLKYIRMQQGGGEELYDLAADPGETKSLADSAPERLRQARELLDRYGETALQLRRTLGLPDDSLLEPDPEWIEHLRELGYVR